MAKLETKFVNEIQGQFFVPSYQRGYRWTDLEVRRLLDDVYGLVKSNGISGNYCLQPIVVRKLEDDRFEIVDGQQRLTTLFLIYNYMYNKFSITLNLYNKFSITLNLNKPKFSIDYETRKESKDFLNDVHKKLNEREDNIDFHFIANAYDCIKEWFAQLKGNTGKHMLKFQTLFEEHVKIIWYEVDETENATDMFTRLNIGKIPLTSAELVKAMFLSRENAGHLQNEIALQWDNIEKELHNDSLWYFLTNNSNDKYQTRIDLVLDLMSGKKNEECDKYYTFFYFDRFKRRGDDLNNTWQEIVKKFLLLKDWHENHEFYHKIGYLIASGYKNIIDIYNEFKNNSKREFLNKLDSIIKDSIKLDKDSNYIDWNYNNNYVKIRRLLLLFNVESVRQNGEESQWFPFDKYKFDKNDKNTWSLEHINAVNSEYRGTQEQWRDWLNLHKKLLEFHTEESLIEEIDKMLNTKNIIGEKFIELQEKISKKFSPDVMKEESIDSIGNLALLKCEDNSALGNSVFAVKRNAIIEMDMAGKFIPFCTKMVFLKYYTRSEKNKMQFWGSDDRRAYLEAINRVLKDFLAEPINLSDRR